MELVAYQNVPKHGRDIHRFKFDDSKVCQQSSTFYNVSFQQINRHDKPQMMDIFIAHNVMSNVQLGSRKQ